MGGVWGHDEPPWGQGGHRAPRSWDKDGAVGLWVNAALWVNAVLWVNAALWVDAVLWVDAALWVDAVLWVNAALWVGGLRCGAQGGL